MSNLTRNTNNPNGISMNCSIDGIDDIVNGIKLLSNEQNFQDIAKVNQSVANDLIIALRSAVPVDKGNLRNSIESFKSKKNANFLWVGPKYSSKKSMFEGGNHAHLIEYGTVDRYVGSRSKYVAANLAKAGVKQGFKGRMTAHPFIRPTYDKMKNSLLEKLKKGYEKVIIDAGKKTGVFSESR